MSRSSKPSKIPKEEAALALSQILERYRIAPAALRGEELAMAPVAAPDIRQGEPTKSFKAHTATTKKPLIGDWIHWSDIAQGPPEPDGTFPQESTQPGSHDLRGFHFIITVLECALPILCQLQAISSAAAKEAVERIPNLTCCRSISDKELAEIEKTLLHDR